MYLAKTTKFYHFWRSIALKYNIRTTLKYRNDMKQTAVEFLESKIFGDEKFSLSEVFEQAKEMEKEKMHAEYMRGWRDGLIKEAPPLPPLDRKIWR